MVKYNSVQQNKWVNFQVEDSPYAFGSDQTNPIVQVGGGIYRAALPTYADGDAAVMHFTSDGKLMVDTELTVDGNVIIDNVAVWATNIADSTTTSFALVDAAGHPQVDVLTLPGGLTGYAEDAVHNTGDIGIMSLAVRNDALAALSDTDGDYSPIQVNANGAVYADIAEFNNNAVTLGAGAVAAGTLRVTLASDDPAVAALEIIDDWDEANRAAVNLIAGQVGVAGGSGVNGATVQRVTVATDDTVATDLTAIKNAVEIMDDWDESDRAKVNPIAGQAGVAAGAGAVDALTQRTTLASDDPAVAALQIIDDWDAVHDSAVSSDGPQVMVEAANFDGAALPNAVAEGDAVRPKASLQGVQYVMAVNEDGSAQPAYDSGTDSFKSFEINPVSEHHAEETLIDVTNETDGTNNYYFDMDGYKYFALQLELSGGSGTMTVTVEATIQDDGTAAASCTYQDVTNDWFGSASFTADAMLERDTPVNVKYVKVKTVSSTGGSNDADATVYLKRSY